ncbi:conserved hypothetical protein [Leishmania infantum JPCM5]|uniref:Uncharacterized protein n=2 Tax=Leishmania infantum TaxID=5671 RepID=A4HWN4_LEIIN|nr:conserved hypothetical protein [Leishmania infantum JPCM5]CAC9473489.1 hypothetical_protein_-_conserved [Leishmania infantum]CAM66864.1 conserved hypothetical protein [Leishmania infantum JPCM5]SUZ40565.1 hypothetical_protein_-_conserved [Leishmania infantum]|eukprot:XP_001464475.1 conserved hypothetical protein [Leishmania infantum JPCM5]
MSCTAKCSGYASLRAECAREPCMASGMCTLLNPRISDCASWCCTRRSGYVFFLVVFFCAGTFALCASYYLHRLHQINVEGGAVQENGEAVVVAEPPTEEEMAAARRKKRAVVVDPALLKELESKH